MAWDVGATLASELLCCAVGDALCASTDCVSRAVLGAWPGSPTAAATADSRHPAQSRCAEWCGQGYHDEARGGGSREALLRESQVMVYLHHRRAAAARLGRRTEMDATVFDNSPPPDCGRKPSLPAQVTVVASRLD
jgi:hypothetical protein